MPEHVRLEAASDNSDPFVDQYVSSSDSSHLVVVDEPESTSIALSLHHLHSINVRCLSDYVCFLYYTALELLRFHIWKSIFGLNGLMIADETHGALATTLTCTLGSTLLLERF